MPWKCLHCKEKVKSEFSLHRKCSKTHNPFFVSGEKLNIATGGDKFLEQNGYCVYCILTDLLHSNVKSASMRKSKERKREAAVNSLLQYVKPPSNASERDRRQGWTNRH